MIAALFAVFVIALLGSYVMAYTPNYACYGPTRGCVRG